ncbi:MAG: YceI family protein [Actinobacteria bacterium]|nr:YceI family protein [Actinomycetota bacterium]
MSATETAGTGQLPGTGTWHTDAAHTSANFSARHLGMSKVRGRFDSLEGTLTIAEDPSDSHVEVTIDASSISTNQPDRDAHLKSADFLDVENHPELTFRSTRIERDGDDWTMEGELTIRGTTQPVTLDVEYLGVMDNPMGPGKRAAFEASTSINRHDFGLSWEGPQELGGILVGKKVTIEIDAQFVSDEEPQQ